MGAESEKVKKVDRKTGILMNISMLDERISRKMYTLTANKMICSRTCNSEGRFS